MKAARIIPTNREPHAPNQSTAQLLDKVSPRLHGIATWALARYLGMARYPVGIRPGKASENCPGARRCGPVNLRAQWRYRHCHDEILFVVLYPWTHKRRRLTDH
jgi:hypothetical protein